MQRLLTLLLCAGLAACATPAVQETPPPAEASVAPEPQPATVPTAWRHVPGADVQTDSPWWKALRDETLNTLILQALQANPDIHIAETRMGQIEASLADTDPDEQAAAAAAIHAAENDLRVVRQGVAHAVALAYLDARLSERRAELLHQRTQLARDLTQALHKKVMAGIGSLGTLREQEQSELDIHQARTRTHHEHEQAWSRLAMLLGTAPVELTLPPANDTPWTDLIAPPIDTPATVMSRRPDVQAAWHKLLTVNALPTDDSDAPLLTQIDQAESTVASRNALYQKTVLTALQDVEISLSGWRTASSELKASQDMLDLLTANERDVQRALSAGRVSRIELLKSQFALNLAQDNVLAAAHAKHVAFAALQLALARD